GGASRMPLVASKLHGRLGVAPAVPEQPELPVAFGALLAADAPAPPPPPTGDGWQPRSPDWSTTTLNIPVASRAAAGTRKMWPIAVALLAVLLIGGAFFWWK